MSKLLILIVAVVALLSFSGTASGARPAHAGKPSPSGTVAIDQTSPSLGDWVTFTTTLNDLPGWANPRVQIMCYQDVNASGIVSRTEDLDGNGYVDDVVFGMAENVGLAIQLGGGSSYWLANGGAAECDATLFYWDQRGYYPVVLAGLTFAAGG